MLQDTWTSSFYGWRVVSAAFVLAVFGLGTGFYGPPIFLNAVQEARGWSLLLVSSAVTTHFLIGAVGESANVVCTLGHHQRHTPWCPFDRTRRHRLGRRLSSLAVV